MAVYSIYTKKSPAEVSKRATVFFGEGGWGLTLDGANPCCLDFRGGGSFVRITITAENEHTLVDIETREWDLQVQEFITKIA